MEYTLVFYDEKSKKAMDVIRGIRNPVVNDNNLSYDDGGIDKISSGFLVLEGDLEIEIDIDITQYINLDKKGNLKPQEEINKAQYNQVQAMLNMMMFDPTKAQQAKQLEDMQKMINNLMFMPKF